MRFQMWIYCIRGTDIPTVIVRDKEVSIMRSGSVLLRDQSSYGGFELVWKRAAFPSTVMDCAEAKGFVIAESVTLATLDANIDPKILQHIWDNRDGN